jgi:hypothetical protein
MGVDRNGAPGAGGRLIMRLIVLAKHRLLIENVLERGSCCQRQSTPYALVSSPIRQRSTLIN